MFAAAFPPMMWVLYVVSLVMCCMGFYKFVYFLSVGYGLAILGESVAMAVMYGQSLSLPTIIILILFVVYGFRLSGFLIIREVKNAAYRKTLKEATKDGEKPMPIFVKATIWIFVSALYVAQVAPVYYRLVDYGKNGAAENETLVWVGAVIMLIGIILEGAADMQKSAQKKVRPDMVATQGLYKIVRCPNYFGEILTWTGVFVSSLNILTGVWQWIVAVFGYICIVYIMFNGAQRLEKRQMGRYGNNAEYKAYAEKTPIIIPLLPIYHLNKEAK